MSKKKKARKALRISIHGHDLDIEAKIADSRLAEVLAEAINRVTTARSSSATAATTPLVELVAEFGKTLRKEQIEVLTNSLDMSQKVLFMEIMNIAKVAQPEN
ncbi:MAG TPA: hypothetical protein VLE97_11200 [Gaiellaceae bacterium]|nr:hypothetical protein [Gaiellaceae bacterium]